MIRPKYRSILLLILSSLTGTAAAQGIGGAVLPADPNRFRSEIDAGVIFPEFSRFKFGDVRNSFPILGGHVLKEVFNERHYKASYYLGARETLKLPGTLFGAPPELSARFGMYNVRHHSSFSESDATPEVYVPYIDGAIRPDLTGGAVVGLFANSDIKLHRKLFSYEIETGLRLSYRHNCWSLMPGIFFTYQRMEQKDFLDTTVSYDPTQTTLLAHVNSNHYDLGVNFRFSNSLCSSICWLGSLALGGEFADGRYRGKQTFAGDAFDDPSEQLAQVNNHRHKWGVSVGGETGFCFFCNRKVSFSILGNIRYINILPYVKYPVPILDTQAVTGPAKLNFQDQLTFGGEANLSVVF